MNKLKMNGKTPGIKRAFSLVAVTLIASFTLSGCGVVKVNPEVDKNTPVASVYGENIKKSEFLTMFDIFKYQYEQKYGTDVWTKDVEGKKFINVAKEKVLDMLIDNKIQLKRAQELGITVSQAEIDEVIGKARTYFATEEKFNEFLSSQKMSLDYFKESTRINLIINKLTEKLTTDVTISDEELNNYYGSHINEFYNVKASHILLDTEEKAKEILARVKNNEDFNKLAEQESKDPTAKENKGELGYFKHGQMVEEFEKVAFGMKPGQISDIVKTKFGYHIIKVEDIQLDKFEAVKEQVKSSLLGKRKDEAYQKLLVEMRKQANIKKFIKNL